MKLDSDTVIRAAVLAKLKKAGFDGFIRQQEAERWRGWK